MTSDASNTAKTVKTRTRRTKRQAAARASGLVASAREIAGQVVDVSTGLVEKVPGTADAVKSGAMDAYRTVESLSKPERQRLATVSLVVGALLWVTGAPRLLTILAFIPAVFVGGHRLASRTQRGG